MTDGEQRDIDAREMQRITARAYFQQSLDDAHAALLLSNEDRTKAQALFMVQQATEKFWKSHIFVMGDSAPKGHKMVDLVRRAVRLEMAGFSEFAIRPLEQYDALLQRSFLVRLLVRLFERMTRGKVRERLTKLPEIIEGADGSIMQLLDEIESYPEEARDWTSPQIRLIVDTAVTLKYDAERFEELFGWTSEVHQQMKVPYRRIRITNALQHVESLRFPSLGRSPQWMKDVIKTIHARVVLIAIAVVAWPHAMAARYPDVYPIEYMRGNLEIGAMSDVALLAHHVNESLKILDDDQYIERRIDSADARACRIAKRQRQS